jgi:hypothetical protein
MQHSAILVSVVTMRVAMIIKVQSLSQFAAVNNTKVSSLFFYGVYFVALTKTFRYRL